MSPPCSSTVLPPMSPHSQLWQDEHHCCRMPSPTLQCVPSMDPAPYQPLSYTLIAPANTPLHTNITAGPLAGPSAAVLCQQLAALHTPPGAENSPTKACTRCRHICPREDFMVQSSEHAIVAVHVDVLGIVHHILRISVPHLLHMHHLLCLHHLHHLPHLHRHQVDYKPLQYLASTLHISSSGPPLYALGSMNCACHAMSGGLTWIFRMVCAENVVSILASSLHPTTWILDQAHHHISLSSLL